MNEQLEMREISKEDKLKLNLNSKNFETKGKRRAISPIIATLLLILIAIAAGVLVYAYVTGFIGNTTTNSGGTLNTISIDQLFLSSKPSAFPVTAFVRNQGPGTESFNTGFYLKGGSVNYQLGPAVIVSGSGTTDTVTAVSLAYASSTSLTVTVTGCSSTDTMTIKGFGNSASAACSSGTASVTLSLTGSGFTVSSGFSATSGSFTGVNVGTGGSPAVVGTAVGAGTILVAPNSVAQLTLAPQGANINSMSSGSTYTFQATGTDTATTVSSAKAA